MRRRFTAIVVSILAAVLIACSSSGTTGQVSPTASSDATAETHPSATATPMHSPTTASSPSAVAASPDSRATPSPAGTPASSVPAAPPVIVAEEGDTLVIRHALGEARVKRNPQKVVVFDFGALDTLDALGVPVTGLPKTNIPRYLAKYESDAYQNVGSLAEPDFEKLSELQPDLIIISGRQRQVYGELNKLGPTLYLAIDYTRYADSVKENVRVLGEIFDKQQEVDTYLTTLEEKIAAVRAKVTAAGVPTALVILVNDRNISAFGPASRFGLVYDVLGFTPIDPNIEVSTHGMNISYEYLVEKNPDYLFVVDRGSVVGGQGVTPAQQTLDNELVKRTKAYQNGHIVYLQADLWYLSGGGLQSFAAMIDEVGNALP